MDKLICVQDFYEEAGHILKKSSSDYYRSGADDEITVQGNRDAYLRWAIRPRVLIDISSVDPSTTILGKKVSFPVGVCPTAFQRVAHPDGEIANAKACEAMGTIFILSTFATSSIEEVSEAAPNCRKWLQLFIHTDRSVTKDLLRRAEAAGFEAIVLTLDAQIVGNRRVNKRNPFDLPAHLRLGNFAQGEMKSMSSYVHGVLEQALTFTIIPWIKRETKLKIVVKGIYSGEDAGKIASMGVDGLIVSNHGGRQLDTVSPTIDILEEVMSSVRSASPVDVYIDGGVSRGSDVYKALALGAKMVFIGRPMVWGLAVGGEEGAKKILQILKHEFTLTLRLAGSISASDIRRESVIRKSHL